MTHLRLWRWIKWTVFFVLVVCICVAGIVFYQGYIMYKAALNEASVTEKMQPVFEKENFTLIEDLPKMYIDAVICVEDYRFYKHGGFDLLATARALFNDLQAGSLVEGGSTITQQLAKNIYFTQEKKFTRKIAEVFMAFEIENTYSKDEIFELYVNSIYFGDGYYSVYDASMGYYGKVPINMNDYESTLLAGIPNAPSVYAPTKNPELARQRQRQVLEKMVRRKVLSTEEAEFVFNGTL